MSAYQVSKSYARFVEGITKDNQSRLNNVPVVIEGLTYHPQSVQEQNKS